MGYLEGKGERIVNTAELLEPKTPEKVTQIWQDQDLNTEENESNKCL